MNFSFVCALVGILAIQTFPPTPPTRPPTNPTNPPGRGGTPQQPTARPMDPRTRSATADALNRYVAGEYERSIKTLSNIGGFEVRHAEEWIVSGGASAVQKRRLIAAVVALDYTASRPGLSPQLYEWAARTLRESAEPQAEEATWLRASVALAEGRGAWTLLTGVSPIVGARLGAVLAIDPLFGAGHLAYALSRFEANPYFKLARVVTVEAQTSPPPGAITVAATGTGVVSDQIDAQMLNPSADAALGPQKRLEGAIEALRELVGDPHVGAEARLRLGYLQLRLGQRAVAVQELSRIETTDQFVAHLAHLFRGWALAKDGKLDEAAAAYRASLTVVPHARSASALFTAFCIQHGRLADAEAAADELMQKPAAGSDPWRTYLESDYREYPALLARLREAVK